MFQMTVVCLSSNVQTARAYRCFKEAWGCNNAHEYYHAFAQRYLVGSWCRIFGALLVYVATSSTIRAIVSAVCTL
jgi:hypothetical protein